MIDAADPNRSERIAQVNQVLSEVGAGSLPQIEVFNKADLIGEAPRVETRRAGRRAARLAVGADRGRARSLLIDAIGEFLGPEIVHRHIVLKPEEGRARARFFAAGAVLAEQSLPGGERRPGGLDAAAGVRAPVPQRGSGADLAPSTAKLVPTRSHS